jgi:selenide,water dikinase
VLEPIYGLVALGLVDPDAGAHQRGAKAGDVLILGKPLGIGILGGRSRRAAARPTATRR